MQSEISEYIPTDHKKKIFNLTPATDEISLVAIQARLHCLRDHRLSYGARCLFCFLLDQSLNPYVNLGKGIVSVSATRIAETLGCYENTIFRWIEQLEAGRHIWKDKQFMPNFWAMNRYHITALDAPDSPTQLPTRDGMWGNGVRRPEAPKRDDFNPPLSKTTAQISGDFLQPVGNELPGNSETTADASQKPRRGAVEKPRLAAVEKPRLAAVEKPRLAAVEKARATAGKNHAPRTAETTDIRETQLTCENQVSQSQSTSKTLKRGGDREKQFLERTCVLIGRKNFERFGGQWTARFREDPDKAERVLADAVATKREGGVHSNPGGFMNSLWTSNFGAAKAVGK
jgi:hypothetical protein